MKYFGNISGLTFRASGLAKRWFCNYLLIQEKGRGCSMNEDL